MMELLKSFDKAKTMQSAMLCAELLKGNLDKFTNHFKDSNSISNFYPQTENVEWTTGFLTGQYWLAWELTGDNCFKESALCQAESFLERIEKKIDVNHHDMGFLYTPSCIAAYKLVESQTGKKAALLAADNLAARFMEKGQFIQAWGDIGVKDNYRLIIDCLLNLPLLYWASDVTGDQSYRDLAERHTKTSLSCLLREDNSTYHTYFFDNQTGEPTRGVTHQGYRDGSAWARGQAWGIYGLALCQRYAPNPRNIELFQKVTDFFLSRLPEDKVCYWDLDFIDGDEPRDSSAAAIAICGILEMAKHLPTAKSEEYLENAWKMLESLMDNYAVKDINQSNGLLLHGVYAKNSPYNPIPADRGVDECNIWGDYFYIEALLRATKNWEPYW